MVKHSNRLSNKKQWTKVRERERDKTRSKETSPGQRGKDRFLPTMKPTAGGKRRGRGRRMMTRGQGVQRIPRGRKDAGKKRRKPGRRRRGRITVQGGRWKTIHQVEKDKNYRKK